MSNVKKYDLEDRTARFGENIIEFAKEIPKTTITIPLISQLVKAGTSVGANEKFNTNAISKVPLQGVDTVGERLVLSRFCGRTQGPPLHCLQ